MRGVPLTVPAPGRPPAPRRPCRAPRPAVAAAQLGLLPAFYQSQSAPPQDAQALQRQREALLRPRGRPAGGGRAGSDGGDAQPGDAAREPTSGAPAGPASCSEAPGDDEQALAGTNTAQAAGRRGRKRRPAKAAAAVSEEELQLAERKARSLGGGASTAAPSEPFVATELIFKLERRGEGWGEEILPRISVEKRPLLGIQRPPPRNRGRRGDPWEEGSPEWYLLDACGIPAAQVDAVMTTATAWRVTSGGRPLIDRRRRSRVARNLALVAEYLQQLGVPPGRAGVGRVLTDAPQVMLCKPSALDRWDRRAVQLAAFKFAHGDCNVSEDAGPRHADLAAWVKRQRLLWQAGGLVQDRMQILGALGFEAGAEAQITEEWEYRFDQLVEWRMLAGLSRGGGGDWLGLGWGEAGGARARECCVWACLQRELRRRSLLPADAIRRLDSLGFPWQLQGGSPEERRWLERFGQLAFSVERARKLAGLAHPAVPLEGSLAPSEPAAAADAAAAAAQPGDGAGDPLAGQRAGLGAAELAWLQQEVRTRRAALAAAPPEAALRFWLARQQRAWRLGRLPAERGLLLRLLGVEFDAYAGVDAWRAQAHEAAAFLLGSQLRQDTGPADAAAAGPGARLRVQRWVLTQQALHAERRLSAPQIRYLALLELTWLLDASGLPGCPRNPAPQRRREAQLGASLLLASAAKQQQLRALHALGWLPEAQAARAAARGVSLRPHRSAEDLRWDARLTQLLAFRRAHGHCRVPREGWPPAPELGAWLDARLREWQRDRLPPRRLAQLAALGVRMQASVPLPQRAPAPAQLAMAARE